MLRKLFFEYWEREDSLIVYLLIDYFITLMYENNIEVQDIIDAVEIGNVDIFNLMPKLNQKISKTKKFDKDTVTIELENGDEKTFDRSNLAIIRQTVYF